MSRLSTITDYWETDMVIKRSALGSIDFSDIDIGDNIPEIHPGEIAVGVIIGAAFGKIVASEGPQ